MSLLQEGQLIRDTYEVERLLGEGAFAEVYRVRHRFLGRQAMKVFKLVGMTLAEIEDMLGEVRLVSSLDHPNIIRVFEANTLDIHSGICAFFTMEYFPGGSLEQFCCSPRGTILPVPTSVGLIRQVCRGLSAAHAQRPPIIHRDLKPANLLIKPEGESWRVCIGDFGVAKRANPHTHVTDVHGSLVFKPPEAYHGLGVDSCAGDVWAMGCTFYLLLTKQLPYPEPAGRDAMHRRRFDPWVPARDFNLEVDQQLDDILARTLAPEPRNRYPHAGAMLDDLNRWEETHGIGVLSPSSAEVPGFLEVEKNSAPPRSLSPQVEEGRVGGTSAAEEEARELVSRAIEVSRQAVNLPLAADLLEQACQLWPPLRDEYQDQIKLWRQGIAL